MVRDVPHCAFFFGNYVFFDNNYENLSFLRRSLVFEFFVLVECVSGYQAQKFGFTFLNRVLSSYTGWMEDIVV